MKNGKSTGLDELPVELYKYLKVDGVGELWGWWGDGVELCNRIYHIRELIFKRERI